MAKVRDILRRKGLEVISIGPSATVLDASTMMNDHKIGGLVVCDQGKVSGIITERDVLRRVVVEQKNPAQATVADVMTRDVICCQLDTPVDEARSIFMNQRIRHLPVVDADEQITGLISIGDLNAWDLDGKEVTIRYLHEYLYGAA